MLEKNNILEFGLSADEVEKLGLEKATAYLKLHYRRGSDFSNNTSIVFADINQLELDDLTKIALESKLRILTKISSALTFFCHNGNDEKRIALAKSYGAIILNIEQFKTIFCSDIEQLEDSNLLYNVNVPQKFSIKIPLSNFNYESEHTDFKSGKKTVSNLYKQTCSCDEYAKYECNKIEKGDIRRLCRHLLIDYKNKFGLTNESPLKKALFENGFRVKEKLDSFKLSSMVAPVYVNLDDIEDWWNVYIAVDGINYEQFGYDPIDKRFALNFKPHGYVTELRKKLNGYYNLHSIQSSSTFVQSKPKEVKVLNQKESTDDDTSPMIGCFTIILFILVILFLIFVFTIIF